jgi:hypothetical protein
MPPPIRIDGHDTSAAGADAEKGDRWATVTSRP